MVTHRGAINGSIGGRGSFAIDGEVGPWHEGRLLWNIDILRNCFKSESKSRKKLKGARFVNFVLC